MRPFEYESRRSGRKRVRNTKYDNETFASLDSPDELENNSTTHQQPHTVDSDSDDFIATEQIRNGKKGVEFHDADGSIANVPPPESDSDVDTASDDGGPKSVTAATRPPRRHRNLQRSDIPEVRTTGVVLNTSHRLSKRRVVSFLAGNSETFNKALYSSLDTWGRYPTIPLRDSCLKTSPFALHSTNKPSSKSDWSWYQEFGADKVFDTHQDLADVSEAQRQVLSDLETALSKHVLIGHDPLETVHKLGVGESTELSNIGASTPSTLKTLSGCWVINTGWPTCSLSWAWSGLGHEQFLAVANSNRQQNIDKDLDTEPQFFAERSSIQVWSVKGKVFKDQQLRIDAAVPPSLRLSIFSNIGAVKSIKWCPFPQATTDPDDDNSAFLGLLAVLYVGGDLSVIRVLIKRDPETPRRVLRTNKLAFYSRPADTRCTCITWVSSKVIIAGCANGSIMTWDVSRHISHSTPTAYAVPIFSHPVHTSHILDVVSCSPSRPDLIITSSVNGNVRLTSLRAPFTDFILSQRSRFSHSSISWHDQTQHALLFDEASMIYGINIRKFVKRTHVGRSEPQPFSLATSPIHASVLAGNTDGSVFVFNPMARLFDTAPDMLQPWFQHQWRRKRETDQHSTSAGQDPSLIHVDQDLLQNAHSHDEIHENPTGTDGQASQKKSRSSSFKTHVSNSAQPDFPNGLSRIVKGFKPSRFVDTSLMLFDKGGETIVSGAIKPEIKGLVQGMVVEEAATGVYSLGWNPTQAAGGWAAAGLGNGLVLIEDLCYDP